MELVPQRSRPVGKAVSEDSPVRNQKVAEFTGGEVGVDGYHP